MHSVEFDSPHLLRREELGAADHLSKLCFYGFDVTDYEADPDVQYKPPERGGTYLISREGTPLSQISIFHYDVEMPGGLLRVGSVGGVCTHPDYRGYGLATRLMEHCTRQLVQEGAQLMLVSGERGLYTRLGCTHAGCFTGFNLTAGTVRSAEPRINLRPATGADAQVCSQLYQAEPVHFRRPLSKFEGHLQHPEGYIHAEQWIVEQDGEPAAYILIGIPWEYLLNPGAGIRDVREYAGDREAIAEGLDAVMLRSNLHEMHVPVAWQDDRLIHLLQERGYSGNPEPLAEHTMRLINFPGLMGDLHGYISARLGAVLAHELKFEQTGPLLGGTPEDRYTIAHGQERLVLDGAAMTRLVLGEPGMRLPAVEGVLSKVISGLFPLPSFFPGLNYQ